MSQAAYNLFFRRRDDKPVDEIDFDKIEKKPDMQFLKKMEQKRK